MIDHPELQPADVWILGELDKLIEECRRGYTEYNFFIPAIAIREFTWNLFAAHYIEMVKGRAYGIGFSDSEKEAAIGTLHTILHTILRLLAPITPFITEYLWQKLYAPDAENFKESIHNQRHPEFITGRGGSNSKEQDKVSRNNGDSQSTAATTTQDTDGKHNKNPTENMTKAITEFNSMVWNEKKSQNLSLKDQIKVEIPQLLKPIEKDLRAMHKII